jgi:hypothetical protein
MRRVCAWCSKFLGLVPPLDADIITHGMCPDCQAKVLADLLLAEPPPPPERADDTGGCPGTPPEG